MCIPESPVYSTRYKTSNKRIISQKKLKIVGWVLYTGDSDISMFVLKQESFSTDPKKPKIMS